MEKQLLGSKLDITICVLDTGTAESGHNISARFGRMPIKNWGIKCCGKVERRALKGKTRRHASRTALLGAEHSIRDWMIAGHEYCSCKVIFRHHSSSFAKSSKSNNQTARKTALAGWIHQEHR